MESRRTPRMVIDPKVRQVGFFTSSQTIASPNTPQPDPISSSNLPSSPPVKELSPSLNSLSPVMIPPPRHNSSDTLDLRAKITSPTSYSYTSRDFPEEVLVSPRPTTSKAHFVKSGGVPKTLASSSSFPGVGIDSVVSKVGSVPTSKLTTVSVVNLPPGISVFC